MGSTFKIISKKIAFAFFLQNLGEIYNFFSTRNAILMTTSCVFITSEYVITFWYSHLHVLNQSWFRVNQRYSALKTQCFRAKRISAEQSWFSLKQRCSVLNFSVLNSLDSEKITADQFWNTTDQPWCSSFSLSQRWKTSNLWNSAVQHWLSQGLQPEVFEAISSCSNIY